MLTKRCSKCGEVKALELFSPHSQTKSGRNSWCNACHYAWAKEFRRVHGRECRAAEYAARSVKRTIAALPKLIERSRTREQRALSRIAALEALLPTAVKQADLPVRPSGVSRHWKPPEVKARRRKRRRERLTDSYVRGRVAESFGCSMKRIPPDVVVLKRERIQLNRLVIQLKGTLCEHQP